MVNKKGFDNFFDFRKGKKRFIAIPHELIFSHTWKLLSRKARISYFNVLSFYNGRNYDNIICPRDKLPWPISSHAWLEGTKELEEIGLISVVRRFGLNNTPNIYRLENLWKKKERLLHNNKP